MEIKITSTSGAWTHGRIGAYTFSVKTASEPDINGLDFDDGPGKIVKLSVLKGFTLICRFERGWDKLPYYDDDQDACAAIIRRFN